MSFFLWIPVILLSPDYIVLYYTTLYYIILRCTILYYIILHYTILYYTVLYCTTPYYTVLHCTILYYTLYYTILYYTILTEHLRSPILIAYTHFDVVGYYCWVEYCLQQIIKRRDLSDMNIITFLWTFIFSLNCHCVIQDVSHI